MNQLLNLAAALKEDLDKQRFERDLTNKIALTHPQYISELINIEFPHGYYGNDPIEVLLQININNVIRSATFFIPHGGREGINIAFEHFKELVRGLEETKDLTKMLGRLL